MYWQIGICAASAAVAGFILYLVPAVREARGALREALAVLNKTQIQLEQTAEESRRLVRLTHQVLEEIRGKMKTADPLLEALEQTGEAAGQLSRSVKLMSGTLADTVMKARSSLHSRKDTFQEVVELTTAALRLWQGRQAPNTSETAAVRADEQ